jgi:hypothetical protein
MFQKDCSIMSKRDSKGRFLPTRSKTRTSKPNTFPINRVKVAPAQGNTSAQNRKANLALGRKMKRAGVPVIDGTRITERKRSKKTNQTKTKEGKE